MKMRKILAAGVAATLAVTSLTAVASAETLTFPMGVSVGNHTFTDVDTHFFGDNTTIVASGNPAAFTTWEGALFIGDKADGWNVKGAKLMIKGTKTGDTAASVNYYDFAKMTLADGADEDTDATEGFTLVLTDDNIINKAGYVNMNVYEAVTDAQLLVTYETTSATQNEYNNLAKVKNIAIKDRFDLKVLNKTGNNTVFAGATEDDMKIYSEATALSAVADTDNIAKIAKYLSESEVIEKEYVGSAWIQNLYALLRQTAPDNSTIMRGNIWKLSDTDWLESTTVDDAHDGDQTYDPATGLGENKNKFAGLASQVADFFNHKTNGTITFKFTPATSADSGWLNGGVPSTQIGLRADLDAKNFAFYVNYASSTGSLEAVTSVDENAGTVTFDISEILADLGGQTKGVVTDLYYGLNQGIDYGWPYAQYDGRAFDGIGLLVEEITLAYEDEAAEDEVIEDEVVEEEETEEEVVEEEEEEVVEEEEEEEVTIEEEEEEVTEEEEEEVDGEMFEEEETEEEDVNPGTGVALAVVPAMIAAAAAVVSKKRK